MKVNEAEVRHVASLAKIRVEEREIGPLVEHFRRIGEHFLKLESLDVQDTDPFGLLEDAPAPLREDEARNWEGREAVLEGAPRREGDFFRVPRIGGGAA